MNDLLLKSLSCKNEQRAPVWLMRQAGRYMPEYRALRRRHTLWELFHNSELAAEVTRLPLELLGVDAAIVFSDILVMAEVFGKKVHFPETGGPKIEPLLEKPEDVYALQQQPVQDVLHYVKDTLLLLKDIDVPLIGFCGGPFTVASYMIDSGGKTGLPNTLNWLSSDPKSFHVLLQKITTASIDYIKMQVDAGVHAVQIFDSWANVLSPPALQEFSFNYLKQMVSALKPDIPVILFCRNSSLYPKELSDLTPSAISFDWHKDLLDIRKQVPSTIAVQGNIDPDLLKTTPSQIISATKQLLRRMQGDKGFIANLGHGVLPDTPVANVKCFVDTVKSFS